MFKLKSKKILCGLITATVLASFSLPVSASGNMKKASGNYTGIKQIEEKKQIIKSGQAINKNIDKEIKIGKKSNKVEYSPGEVIVKFKNTTGTLALDPELKDLKIEKVKNLGSTKTTLMKIKDGKSVEEVVEQLKKSKLVEYAEPNYKVYKSDVTDPRYGELWGMKNTGQKITGSVGVSGVDINVEKAWQTTQGDPNVVVAVIDEGVDFNHPDLVNRQWVNTSEAPGNGIDDDGNGYIDDVNGWDFFNNDNTVYDQTDGDLHGTHVSGTIAGNKDQVGVIGVAPNVKIMSLKFLGPIGGYVSDAVLAINYAKDKGVKISNNSWGGGGYSQALYDAINNSGSLFIAAAGNWGADNDEWPDAGYPSSFDCANIISVAATDNTGNLADFSNYGVNSVDIAAPGVGILSTVPKYGKQTDYSDSYEYFDGTSMAAPHVTGSAALVWSAHPSFTASKVKSTLLESATRMSTLTGKMVSGGMLNVGKSFDDYELILDMPGVPLTGEKVSGTLDDETRLDNVYAISLKKGEQLALTLKGNIDTDFDLYIFDHTAVTVNAGKGILKSSETSGTSSETLTFIPQSAGTYYIDVYGFEGKGAYTLSVQRGAPSGIYEDTSNLLNYSELNYEDINYVDKDFEDIDYEQWETITDTSASNKTYTSTNFVGASMEMFFTGTGIRYNALKNSDQGMAKVTIDGKNYNVDLYSSSAEYKNKVFDLYNLEQGVHTLKIEWTGLASSQGRKASTSINIDSIQVLNDTTPPTVPVGLAGKVNSSNKAALTWKANTESNLAGYIVQRAVGTQPQETAYADISGPVTGTTYTDAGVTLTKEYSYRLLAIDTKGNRSLPSAKVSLGEEVVRVEDGNSSISYSGKWSNSLSSKYSGGTLKYIKATASAEMKFTGTGIRWIALKNNNYGTGDVYIDGKKVKTVNLYSATTKYKQLVFEAKNLSSGNHTVKIVYTGKKDPLATGTSINVDALDIITTSSATIEDNNSSVTYSGKWNNSTSGNYSGGTLKYINTAAASAEMKFTGTSVRWIAAKRVNYGNADVYVDGKKVKTVNLYSATTKYKQLVFEAKNLSLGNHTIKIVCIGKKDPLATGTYVNLDSFEVRR